MRLTHRQVEIFRALMTAGSVTKAADMLFTSQPTVSRELARMEQLIGVALFERVRGRLQPTMPALTLYEEVKRAYAGLERVMTVASGLRDFAAGPLAVLSLPVFAHSLLPHACRRFHKLHPDARVSITAQDAPLLGEWLTAQRYDLGLTEDDVAPPATNLTPLLEADEVCVLPEGHPLLKKEILELEDFSGHAFISLSADDPYRIKVDEAFATQGVERRLIVETTSAVSVCSFVRQGLGVAIVNPLTAMEFEGQGLHVRPLVASFPFRVSLVQPEYRPLNPLLGDLITSLQSAAEEICERLAHLALKRKNRFASS